jgi:hypothetical protein
MGEYSGSTHSITFCDLSLIRSPPEDQTLLRDCGRAMMAITELIVFARGEKSDEMKKSR